MEKAVMEADIVNGLQKIGIRPGMALEVHASLGALGYVEGGADAVIRALMAAVGPEGAIVMPSFRLSRPLPLTEADRALGLTLKIRILDPDETPSGMGAVADTFRRRPDTLTGEGLFRVTAWGKDARIYAKGLRHLINTGGYALLMGVDIYRLSAMHYVEDALPEAVKEKFRPSEAAVRLYPQDQWFIEAWSPACKPWHTIQQAAYDRGLITDGFIGGAKCMLLPVKPVIFLYREALERDALGLYGLS